MRSDLEFAVKLLIAREVHYRSLITPFKTLEKKTGIPAQSLANIVRRMVRAQRQKVKVIVSK